MNDSRLTGSAEAFNVYLRKSVLVYLNGQENWKFVMGVIRESGLGKDEARDVLRPGTGAVVALKFWIPPPPDVNKNWRC